MNSEMNIQNFIEGLLIFTDDYIIPLLFTLAFVFFLWNATKYFIIGADSEDEREKARALALWGILAFVAVASIWGVVNLINADLFGTTNTNPITPDYMCEKLEINCEENPDPFKDQRIRDEITKPPQYDNNFLDNGQVGV